MEMSLLNAGLAAGAALAAIPVLLHLFMRQTPKHVIFPALRLIRERQRRSRKRLRVKNWLLLLARMAVLALMALALARPRLYSEAPLGDESAPTALGLVIDTSLSMNYVEKDKSRLEEAKERAREILGRLPDSSVVFVVDSAAPGVPSGLPPAAALKVVDGLTVHPVNRPLNAAMGQVYAGVADCDRPVHVVYVLTDLARSAWAVDKPAEGLELVAAKAKSKTAAKPRTATFIMSLAPREPRNVSVEAIDATSTVATDGEPLGLSAVVRSQGTTPVTRAVEFYLDDKKRGEQQVTIEPGGQALARFETPPRFGEGAVHRAEIRLSGEPDPLPDDDRRYFTFKVRPPLRALLIADSSVDSEFVAAALDPDPTAATRSVRVDRARPANLARMRPDDLRGFAAVFLLSVAELDDAGWALLTQYVRDGGGLVVSLGPRTSMENFTSVVPSQLLPAKLAAKAVAPDGATFGKVADLTHPLFEQHGKELAAQLGLVPIYRYWNVVPTENASRVLVTYSDGAPALVERVFKGPRSGRVLLWTTPLSQLPSAAADPRKNPNLWNLFPNPSSGWSFLVLMDRSVTYLAGATIDQLNFEAGESAIVALDPQARFSRFLLTSPDGKTTEELTPSPTNQFLEVVAPRALGPWKLSAIGPDNQATAMGFSVNAPRGESRLTPLEPSDLDVIFGKDGYQLAQDVQTFKDQERTMRVGHEIFPWLMFLIMLVITIESTVANTFYKEAKGTQPAGA